MTCRILYFLYGLAGHAGFLAVFLYMALFLANVLAPKTVDSGEPGNFAIALLINLGLLALFGVQHSIMARPTFKRWWTKFVPNVIERATYVHLSNLCMIAILAFWQPMPNVIWDVEQPIARGVIWGVFAAGWLMIVLTSFLINHFDLFGTRQVWLHLIGREYTPVRFRSPFVYRWVRHPLYVGWITAFWVTPTMTVGHLLFAGGLTAYILVAIKFEERNLIAEHGESYVKYRRTTPALIPFTKRSPAAARPAVARPKAA